jgi:hypothetical protein
VPISWGKSKEKVRPYNIPTSSIARPSKNYPKFGFLV